MSSSHHHHNSSSSSSDHQHRRHSSSDQHHGHSSSSSDHGHKRRRRHRRNEGCFAFDSRRNTFGSENLTVVGTVPPNRVELARVVVPCSGVVKLDGVVGWQAITDASSGNRVPLLFEIFRNTVDPANLIFSTLDSAAIVDSIDNGARFVTTGFTTVDARFPFTGGMTGSDFHSGFPFERGTTYILTATAVEPGDRALITGPVVLEATVERRRREKSSSSSDHHRRRRCDRCHRSRCRCHRPRPCKCACPRKRRVSRRRRSC